MLKKYIRFLKSIPQNIVKDLLRPVEEENITTLPRQFIQFIYFLIKSFLEQRLLVRASALTYATLLSIVPLLAFMFSMLKAFGFYNKLEESLATILQPLGQQAINVIIPNVVTFVENVNVKVIGTAGLLFLVFSIISVINNIETSFNDIWKVNKTRSLHRRVSDYISVLVLGPLLIFIVLGITASLQSNTIVQTVTAIPGISFLFHKSAPLVISWVLLFFLIAFIPNTKVKLVSAALGALVAGTLWHLTNFFFTNFIVDSYQTGAKGAIYTGFATLPLLLIWIYLGWAIVLLGALVAFLHQNFFMLIWRDLDVKLSRKSLDYLSLSTLLLVARYHDHGKTPPGSETIAKHFSLPVLLITQTTKNLIALKLIYSTNNGDGYLPAKNIHKLKIHGVLEKINNQGFDLQVNKKSSFYKIVTDLQNRLITSQQKELKELTIKDLLDQSIEQK